MKWSLQAQSLDGVEQNMTDDPQLGILKRQSVRTAWAMEMPMIRTLLTQMCCGVTQARRLSLHCVKYPFHADEVLELCASPEV